MKSEKVIDDFSAAGLYFAWRFLKRAVAGGEAPEIMRRAANLDVLFEETRDVLIQHGTISK